MAKPAKVHDRSGEGLDIGNAVRSAEKLATHFRPGLDVLLAIWICQRLRKHVGLPPAEVLFVPAFVTGVDEGVLGIDLGGSKGLHKFGGGFAIKRSAIKGTTSVAFFRALPDEDRELLEPLVLAISDAEERGGENVHIQNLRESLYPNKTSRWNNYTLRNQILATTMWSVYESVCEILDEERLVDFWNVVFDGHLRSRRKAKASKHASENAEYLYEGTLAILPTGAPPPTTRAAFMRGAKIVMFSESLGNNMWALGITKRSGDDTRRIDFNDYKAVLHKYVPNLWVHENGALAGWTARSPLICTSKDFASKYQALRLAVEELALNVLKEGDKAGQGG